MAKVPFKGDGDELWDGDELGLTTNWVMTANSPLTKNWGLTLSSPLTKNWGYDDEFAVDDISRID
jgi:hypothetical protein